MAKPQKFDYEDIEDDLKKCRRAKTGDSIITCLARTSYVYVQKQKPNKRDPDAKKKYEISLLIPPGFSISLLKKDVQKVIDEKWGEKVPGRLKMPFSDAGDYKYDGYEAGWTRIRATSIVKPTVLDGLDGNAKITDDDDPAIYPGRWALATLKAFAYVTDENKGVSFGLNNLKLMYHDEKLGGGRTSAEDEFGVDDEYEDMKKTKRSAFDEDDDAPRKPSKKKAFDDDEEEDYVPRAKKHKSVEDDDEDDRPVKKKRRVVEDDEEEEAPRPRKRKPVEDDDDEDYVPRKKRRPVDDEEYD